MHRRQYLTGSHMKLNRDALAKEVRILRDRVKEAETISSLATESTNLLAARYEQTIGQRLRRFFSWLRNLLTIRMKWAA